ncbi:DNA mismatch repair endonuclease MutL [Clostridium swellfunianum]|uniref:DNA mismatch repair endonuclease MutL n=1 Tax=Clostridium swellfunianum TaxID=1367462 RepID=UPI00202E3B79|nr:DNA mismatch repair endonuclease MutL [Clostridium swellfunianum]MCM0648504.1 DNA mismatch repair endonuclease MutL [Clostridium swellfunianum]
MKRINLLDIDTSNKIAAGEVVERPFSVVKELVENSLDANSKNITVEIADGGQKTIKITDDGEGIHPEDIEKAFLPHATSKISLIEDIYSINTFGFRGEALASIAAVSNTILKTRTTDFDFGSEISISGGKVNSLRECACNVGSSIEVNDLFYNVPARLKFMKSTQREAALIIDIVERLALVNSNVSFKVYSNSNKALTTFSSNDVTDTIRAIYGKSVYENIIPIEKHSDIASVHGYIGSAEISRGSRNNQSIFVNKRYVKNKLITTAVENAFKSFLTINKYPFFVLFIDIFPELIDVNVHPTKSEIKFKDERFIFKFVFDAVHEALRKSLKDSFRIEPLNLNDFEREERSNLKSVVQIPIDFKLDVKEPGIDFTSNNGFDNTKEFMKIETNRNIYGESIDTLENALSIKEASYSLNKELSVYLEQSKFEAKLPVLNIIGQFNDTYILAQGGEELFIIDQHAAHEKILFEQYTDSVNNRKVVAQILASPVVIELSTEDFVLYSENINIFKTTGFNIDIFGQNTISIREVPIILGNIEIKSLFLSIIDNLKAMGSGEAVEVKYNKIATLSCKSAVKAKDKLSTLEMKALIERLRFIREPFTCPHGRPTIIKITLTELEKRFKRIQ